MVGKNLGSDTNTVLKDLRDYALREHGRIDVEGYCTSIVDKNLFTGSFEPVEILREFTMAMKGIGVPEEMISDLSRRLRPMIAQIVSETEAELKSILVAIMRPLDKYVLVV